MPGSPLLYKIEDKLSINRRCRKSCGTGRKKIGTSVPVSGGFQLFSSKLTPQLRQVTVIFPLPRGTRSCCPQLGHLK